MKRASWPLRERLRTLGLDLETLEQVRLPESDLRDWKNARNASLSDPAGRNVLSRRFLLGILLELDKGIGYLLVGGKLEALSARHDLIEYRNKERPDLRLLELR